MFVTNWISPTKIQKISEITNFFRHYFLSRTEVFFVYHSPDLSQVFSKSASEELSKWQICGQFGHFCSLTIRKGEVC